MNRELGERDFLQKIAGVWLLVWTGIVTGLLFSKREGFAALLRDHGEEQFYDLCQERDAMLNNFVVENVM